MSVLEILLRGMAAGSLLAVALAILATRRHGAPAWTGAVFCVSAAAFALHSQGAETQALGVLQPLVWLLSAGGAGWFWLFAVSLFEDRPFHWTLILPAAGMTALAGVAHSLPDGRADGAWVVHNLLEIALAAHVLSMIARSWSGDLVDARRSLRGPFIGFVALYTLGLSSFEIADALGRPVWWEGPAQAATLAAIALGSAAVLLRPAVFAPRTHALQPDGVDVRDRLTLERLMHLVEVDEVWRQEGLTIGALARMLGVPEHRLRRLVNRGLGHRNFASFLNGMRIRAAKQALADPLQARTPISSLAFDLGYASLSPFNKSFREETGLTPTAWRDAMLRGSSIPENAG
jgi:AraC-like DNA-binding protein